MNSSLSIQKRLFPYGFQSEYNLEANLVNSQLETLISLAFSLLLPKAIEQQEFIMDLKGREERLLIDQSLPDEIKPKEGEIFYVSGEYPVLEKDEDDEQEGELILKPFSISANTSFHDYQGRNHIRYKLRIADLAKLLPIILGQSSMTDQDINIQYFRLGIELFKTRLLAYFLGSSPSVNGILLIEASRTKLMVRILADALTKKNSLPLKQEFFQKVDQLGKTLLSFSLIQDYKRLSC